MFEHLRVILLQSSMTGSPLRQSEWEMFLRYFLHRVQDFAAPSFPSCYPDTPVAVSLTNKPDHLLTG